MTVGEVVYNLAFGIPTVIAYIKDQGLSEFSGQYITIQPAGDDACCAYYGTDKIRKVVKSCIEDSWQFGRTADDVIAIVNLVRSFELFNVDPDLVESVDNGNRDFVSDGMMFHKLIAKTLSGYVFVPDNGDFVVEAERGAELDNDSANTIGTGRWYNPSMWAKIDTVHHRRF